MRYRIHALKNGTCKVAGHHVFHGGDPETVYEFPLIVWLLEGGEFPILVDTGLANVDEMNRGAAHVLAEPITQRPDETMAAHLDRLGLKPEEIGAVFLTHLHFDHVDQLEDYPNARIIVSKHGLAEATKFPGWVGSWAPGKTLELLTRTAKERVLAADDANVLPGIDVFWLGGHTPCSQAVSVHTTLGEVVLAGDAVFRIENLERRVPIGIADSLDEARIAIDLLRSRDAIVLPSHDPSVFERFPGGIVG